MRCQRAPLGERARLVCAVLGVTGFLGVAGCGPGGTQPGHALQRVFGLSIGDKPIRPGTEIGLLYTSVDNVGDSTIVIDSIGVSGPGIGAVVTIVQVEMAPLRFGRHNVALNWAPGASYTTDPPVFFGGSGCHKQLLVPVKGFRMTPGSLARIWIVLRAVRPGRWVIPFHVVNYTSNGVEYRQVIHLRAYGSVADHAAYIPPYWAMAKCVGPQTGARFLPGYHAGKVSR